MKDKPRQQQFQPLWALLSASWQIFSLFFQQEESASVLNIFYSAEYKINYVFLTLNGVIWLPRDEFSIQRYVFAH